MMLNIEFTNPTHIEDYDNREQRIARYDEYPIKRKWNSSSKYLFVLFYTYHHGHANHAFITIQCPDMINACGTWQYRKIFLAYTSFVSMEITRQLIISHLSDSLVTNLVRNPNEKATPRTIITCGLIIVEYSQRLDRLITFQRKEYFVTWAPTFGKSGTPRSCTHQSSSNKYHTLYHRYLPLS